MALPLRARYGFIFKCKIPTRIRGCYVPIIAGKELIHLQVSTQKHLDQVHLARRTQFGDL